MEDSRKTTSKETRTDLYAAAQYIASFVEKELGVQIPFDVYLQDPMVAASDPKFGFDEGFYVVWEPGMTDGPTSARFAVVDYNGDTGSLAPMAKWDEEQEKFLDPEGKVVDKDNSDNYQFHQVNVWAVLQRALDFFEDREALGRRIPFGFDGNRLIVVPHAGYGRNAFYDRKSKSLQFYYFDHDDKRVYTCLSTDIIHHEFGHAILDGIRPYFIKSTLVETAAFHEFVGDLTAILIILTNKTFRDRLAEKTDGRLSEAKILSSIADQFGTAVTDNPYLRSALNTEKMSKIKPHHGPHHVSQVMTGAMFDILIALSEHYIEQAKEAKTDDSREKIAKDAFENAINLMRRIAIQPLDLLPPVDVTFKDYAMTVLRSQSLANPTDPHQVYQIILKAFAEREILDEDDVKFLNEPRYLHDRLKLNIYHNIDSISRSKAAAYRFLDDNRPALLIPSYQDVIVADLYDANKSARQNRRLPRQIILEYIWHEEVKLEGEQFEEYDGQITTLLCGGTLVFDDKGSVLSWFRKPGTEISDYIGDENPWPAERAKGLKRKDQFLEALAERIKNGQIGSTLGSSKGMLQSMIPPVIVTQENERLTFELSPHLSFCEDYHHSFKSKKKWEVSS